MLIKLLTALLSSDIVQTMIIGLLLSFIGWLGLRWRWTRKVVAFAIEAYHYTEKIGLGKNLKGYQKYGPFMDKFIESYYQKYGKFPDHNAKGIAVKAMEQKVKAEKVKKNTNKLLTILPLVLVFYIATPVYAATQISTNENNTNSVYITVLVALLSAAIGIIGYFLRDLKSSMQSKNDNLNKAIQDVDKDLTKLKITMPANYVLRDDFLRAIANLDHKFDSMSRDISEINKNLNRMLGGDK